MTRPDYVTLVVNQINQTWGVNNVTGLQAASRIYTPIEMTKCGVDRWNYTNVQEITSIGFDYYYCPKVHNLTVGGVYNSPEFMYIEIKVQKCVNSASCASLTLIDKAILGQFNLVFVERYFDISLYQDPIKQFLTQYFYNIVPTLKKKSDIYI